MKRCPECLFLYPESDERCDFDKTPLEVIDDAEIDAATRPSAPLKRRRRALPVVLGGALLLGVLMFAIYYALSRQTPQTSAATQHSNTTSVVLPSEPAPVPSPTPSPVPSPSPSQTSSPKTVASASISSHSRSTTDPVSTSGPGIGTRQGGKPVIQLNSGGRIEADEVWRTKDGVWYRRNGMVTLLKRSQVKNIGTR